jgi:adenine-specific DNA-methyltransferase
LNRDILNYLSNYSQDAKKIDRLITSAYLVLNDIRAKKNNLIKAHTIKNQDSDWKHLDAFVELLKTSGTNLNFEALIELFEFVVSPADKIINGAVYTPAYIRNYIINESLNTLKKSLTSAYFGDFACGCGAFLFSLAVEIRKRTKSSFNSIFSKCFGLDITPYSVKRTEILLSLLAISEGEDIEEFDFKIFCGNALNFDFKKRAIPIQKNSGFDIIVGNPPYVCSRNMDVESLSLIKNWEVARTGHPDLYIPFFQIGLENLTKEGILGLITVNTFIKSINGRALRNYLSDKRIDFTIINFGGEQIFRTRNTYTCICFLSNNEGSIKYLKTKSQKLLEITESHFYNYSYDELQNMDGWNLVGSEEIVDFVKRIEATGSPFKEKYITRNGIATLKNHIYKFTPFNDDESFYFLRTKSGKTYPIEKEICRDIINANKVKETEDLVTLREKIIFPYIQSEFDTTILQEQRFIKYYPKAYKYLQDHKAELSTRDKGKGEYESWYAYGRRQSLDIASYKLFFPHICERPTFVISESRDLLFYNGIAVISDSIEDLEILKRILESDVFFWYVRNTTKDYSSGYISLSRNYIKNFGIVHLTKNEKNQLLKSNDQNSLVTKFYESKSGIKISKLQLESL